MTSPDIRPNRIISRTALTFTVLISGGGMNFPEPSSAESIVSQSNPISINPADRRQRAPISINPADRRRPSPENQPGTTIYSQTCEGAKFYSPRLKGVVPINTFCELTDLTKMESIVYFRISVNSRNSITYKGDDPNFEIIVDGKKVPLQRQNLTQFSINDFDKAAAILFGNGYRQTTGTGEKCWTQNLDAKSGRK